MSSRPTAPRPNAPRASVPLPRPPSPPRPRAPESTGKLDSADTNPLPHVSTAKAWTSIEARNVKRPSSPVFPVLPKATPIIRDKLRADGTEEILASDIMIVVPKASAPRPGPRATSTGEIDAADILSAEPVDHEIEVEVEEPAFRPPAFSINATQEILADDVLEVQAAALQLPQPQQAQPQQPAGREEAPSAPPPPWTIDAHDAMAEFEFPSGAPKMSGPYPALSSGPRLTNFSATEVFRRRSRGMKVVVASVSFAAAVVAVAGVAKLSPSLGGSGPVGIAVHGPKSLDKRVRARERIVGVGPRSVQALTLSIDDLAPVPHR